MSCLLSFFCRDSSSSSNNNKKKRLASLSEHQWPLASERIRAAQAATQNGHTWMTNVQNPNLRYCIDVSVAKAFLEHNEDTCMSDDDDDDRPTPCFVLQKPTTNNLLLQHALTTANGDTWRRQRPIVARALNRNSKELQACIRSVAAEEMLMHCCNQQQQQQDARPLALRVASTAIAHAVVSSQYAPRLVQPLRQLFQETLQPLRGGNTAAHQELHTVVTTIVQELLQTNDTSSCCIAASLLQEKGAFLSLEEITSNIHSALLAGTQAMATTLTTALVLLQQQQTSCATICQEALRVLPPVAALPRCCATANNNSATTTTIFSIDLLALAHSSHTPSPFGIGHRSCPAGNLSVVGVTAALDAMRSRYKVMRPSRDNDKNWMDAYGVSYRPTLTFGNPVWITFEEAISNR